MENGRAQMLLAWLEEREPEIVALLERLVGAESPSTDSAAQQAPSSILAEELVQGALHSRPDPLSMLALNDPLDKGDGRREHH
jgi:hypothetical protein